MSILKVVPRNQEFLAIKYADDGSNLKEVLNFTGRHPDFDKYFKSWEEYETHVKSEGGKIKLIYGRVVTHVYPGEYIVALGLGEGYHVLTELGFNQKYVTLAGAAAAQAGNQIGDAAQLLEETAKQMYLDWLANPYTPSHYKDVKWEDLAPASRVQWYHSARSKLNPPGAE